ncbi:hypothetical protein HPB47_011397 [Ixodes persulcatus]|uniref:Uncharacterized protein n=1 Tax=Ixodes persulcatus TaxID=34615 RepID=A0AC60NWF2_IXOPE|nr:hypothetical protein HPB47_011397 [Ixodes persulcatus]
MFCETRNEDEAREREREEVPEEVETVNSRSQCADLDGLRPTVQQRTGAARRKKSLTNVVQPHRQDQTNVTRPSVQRGVVRCAPDKCDKSLQHRHGMAPNGCGNWLGNIFCKHRQMATGKILIILELTVIANGADVGSKLGNPAMPSSTGAAAPSDGDGASNRTPVSSEFAASVKPPGGAQFPARNTQRKLPAFPDAHFLTQGYKKILIILELTVIANGADVGSKLGNPAMPSSTGAAAPSDGDGASNRTPVSSEFAASVKPPGGAQFPARNTQPAPMQSSFRSNGGPLSTSAGDVVVLPICSLTPYQNKWTIRARVTNKSAIRTWNNARGEGKLFSMDLLDESGEIRATAFNAECDRFYDLVEVNKVYYISRANLKTANPKFSSLKNEFEMSFTQETAMTPCEEAAPHIPTLQFNFVPIRRLQDIGADKVTVVRRSNNQELKKRDISLVDKSSAEVSLTLWGDQVRCPPPCLANSSLESWGWNWDYMFTVS